MKISPQSAVNELERELKAALKAVSKKPSAGKFGLDTFINKLGNASDSLTKFEPTINKVTARHTEKVNRDYIQHWTELESSEFSSKRKAMIVKVSQEALRGLF